MEYKKSLKDVSRALETAKPSGQVPAITDKSTGVRVKRALDKIERLTSR